MLKIARAQTHAHKSLAVRFIDDYRDEVSTEALEQLMKDSFRDTPVQEGYVMCLGRGARFHLDRRMALYDWLLHQSEWLTSNDFEQPWPWLESFHVSVMAWGDSFLYSYHPSDDSVAVRDIDAFLSDLSWYHTSWLVPYISTNTVEKKKPAKSKRAVKVSTNF